MEVVYDPEVTLRGFVDTMERGDMCDIDKWGCTTRKLAKKIVGQQHLVSQGRILRPMQENLFPDIIEKSSPPW